MDREYAFKHWTFTLLIAPVFVLMYFHMSEGYGPLDLSAIGFYLMVLLCSVVLSIPTFICYCGIYYFLNRRRLGVQAIRPILIIVAMLGISITFLLLGGTLMMVMIGSYSLAAVIAGLLLTPHARRLDSHTR